MGDYQFWSLDRHFGISLPSQMVEKAIKECLKAAGKETGGILMGYYTPDCDCAVVTDLTGPPRDSTQSRASFYRGIQGLQKQILKLWRGKRHYYLGEWHYHPGGTPVPSGIDDRQMMEISTDKKTKCPEPVLLLVGGDPSGKWEPRAYVYPCEREREELLLQKDR